MTKTKLLAEIDLQAVYDRCEEPERALVRELLATQEPRQAIVVVELLAYFPSAKVDNR